jgi:hypothetical protein
MALISRGRKTRRTWGLVGFLLVLMTASLAQAEPPSLTHPGRKPDSMEPWGAFLGKAAHEVIGIQYTLEHPTHRVFLNHSDIRTIVREGRLGEPERLSELVSGLRPDITDTFALVLFEIKPDTEDGRLISRTAGHSGS